jgi:hypothetical protein
MMPEDRIPTKRYGDIEAYLVESRSFGALSGSPVFISETLRQEGTTDDPFNAGKKRVRFMHMQGGFYLLGLAHGSWEVDEKDARSVRFQSPKSSPGVNLGLTVVTPAHYILQALNHPTLQAMRREIEQTHLDAMPTPTEDGRAVEDLSPSDAERLKIELRMDDAKRHPLQKGRPRKGRKKL